MPVVAYLNAGNCAQKINSFDTQALMAKMEWASATGGSGNTANSDHHALFSLLHVARHVAQTTPLVTA